jgi:hypothetical protein
MHSNPLKAGVDFKAKQHEFAAYIRDPENNPPPADVPPQRMAMYRELFFNNIDSFLAANFPVIRAILTDSQWFELAQDFFAKHSSQTPHFSEIPEEFLDYLQNERNNPNDFPFLLELAHYEWVEMALSIAKDSVPENRVNLDNLEQQRVRLSPVAWPLAYRYPVHKISPDFLPQTAPDQATFLVVYRNPDDEVNFIEITPITYRLLEIIQQHEQVRVADCLQQIAVEANHPNPETVITGGLLILNDLLEKTVVVLA